MIDDITLRSLSPAGTAATSRDVTISAVKGIRTSTRVAQLFVEFDRKQLTPEQRREVIRKTFTRQDFHQETLRGSRDRPQGWRRGRKLHTPAVQRMGPDQPSMH
jgi:hypothetical protein